MQPIVLELANLAKSFGPKNVLEHVDLSVRAGSVVGLLGKNGAGKSTLIKCALGLFRPRAGTAAVFGEDAWTLSAAAKSRIGYVPQAPAHFPWMRVGQMIDYTASFYPRWNDKLVESWLRDWELNPKDRIGPLSPGQQQKLAILLALGHEPDLLVLDEPAAALDPGARRDFVAALVDQVGDGRAILFSTHITSDLERVAERIAILDRGRIVLDDELGSVKDRVKRLHVHADEPLPPEFAVPGALRTSREGSQALVSVNAACPELVESIERRWSAAVEVEDLSLEDIFLEVTGVS